MLAMMGVFGYPDVVCLFPEVISPCTSQQNIPIDTRGSTLVLLILIATKELLCFGPRTCHSHVRASNFGSSPIAIFLQRRLVQKKVTSNKRSVISIKEQSEEM